MYDHYIYYNQMQGVSRGGHNLSDQKRDFMIGIRKKEISGLVGDRRRRVIEGGNSSSGGSAMYGSEEQVGGDYSRCG